MDDMQKIWAEGELVRMRDTLGPAALVLRGRKVVLLDIPQGMPEFDIEVFHPVQLHRELNDTELAALAYWRLTHGC